MCYVGSVYFFASQYPNRIEIIWCAEFVYHTLLGLVSILYLRTNHWVKKEI